MPIPDTPYTRKEAYLNAIATGDSGGIPETPYTREEMYLDAIAKGGGGGSPSTLSGLTDVDISNPTDGQTLVYNSTSVKWENGAGGGSGGGDDFFIVRFELSDYNSEPRTYDTIECDKTPAEIYEAFNAGKIVQAVVHFTRSDASYYAYYDFDTNDSWYDADDDWGIKFQETQISFWGGSNTQFYLGISTIIAEYDETGGDWVYSSLNHTFPQP